MAYTAFVLSEKSRAKLLQEFPPKFPDVVCHHVTDIYGVSAHSGYVPSPAEIVVIGYTCDDSLECLVVTVNGSTTRQDGKTYHITHSLDRSQGRRPVDSNAVIATNGWDYTNIGIEIQTTPELLK